MTAMKTVSRNRLQAEMPEICGKIEQSGEELVVTDDGRPVLSIRPILHGRSFDEMVAGLDGSVVFHEDLDTPFSRQQNVNRTHAAPPFRNLPHAPQ
jgi:antitoxin (DNA-binding transcriptional repressor) of toxin-antitoxin stability system